ncbi:MAG TPA: hypothetical protein VGC12_01625 [Methyloradius sp.]
MKKFTCHIIAFLILALTAAPALAAVCSMTCMPQIAQDSVANDQMSMGDMHCDECPKSTQNSDQDHQSPGHTGCSMAGCHFAQSVPFTDLPKVFTANSSYLAPIYFNSLGTSADLSPPLKPPA